MTIYTTNSTNPIEPLALRPKQAAEVLGISQSTLERLTRAGEIPHFKVQRCTRYSVEVLKNWLVSRTEGGSHEAH